MDSLDKLVAGVRERHHVVGRLHMDFGGWRCEVRSNSQELLLRLEGYFHLFLRGATEQPDAVIEAYVGEPPELEAELVDWKRDPGKTGRKDAFADIPGGRVCHKVRTGMRFLVGSDARLAIGPALENSNQVINFIGAQYMTARLHEGYQLCHAAAVGREDRAVAIAGISGAGKSSLALHMLQGGVDFYSNDRILVRKNGETHVSGVPKYPRINPGTALSIEQLHDVMPPERVAAHKQLSRDELWDLEEKYDVFTDKSFPGCRFRILAPLKAFFVLTWDRRKDEPARVKQVELRGRDDLLAAVMKHPGPFFVPAKGEPPRGVVPMAPEPYLEHLAGVPIFEVSGGVDFDAAKAHAFEALDAG